MLGEIGSEPGAEIAGTTGTLPIWISAAPRIIGDFVDIGAAEYQGDCAR